jgi:predicted MPP superfamily phosphohydrolase
VRAPRIHVLSDLHLDTGPYALPAELEFDILVAAGDIGPIEVSVPWLAALNKPVVYVLGNHEHYGRAFTETLTQAKALAAGTQVHVLERESVVIQGVRFLGATLWTSYGDWHPELAREAHYRMNDYREIAAGNWSDTPANAAWLRRHCRKAEMRIVEPEEGQSPRFHPAMAYREHVLTIKWLERMLTPKRYPKRKQKPLPTVVVTHQAPTFAALRAAGIREELLKQENWERRYRDRDLVRVAAYASPLEPLLQQHGSHITFWAHGHMHHGHDTLVAGVRVLCNPRGHHLKPLTEKSAEAYRFWGVPVSQEHIERSQANYAANPYDGDAFAFEPSLVVDLEDGAARPIALAMAKPLERLRELRASAASLVPYVFKGAERQREAVVRCFEDDCKQFREVLEAVERDICESLDLFYRSSVIRRLSAPFQHPHAPWPGFREPVTTADYEKTVAGMDEWIAWGEALPQATRRALADWAAQAYRALAVLAARGITATVVRPSVKSLRRLVRGQVTVAVDLDEAACRALEDELDRLVNPRIPRTWSISVWSREDCDEIGQPGVTLAELAPWDQGLPLVPAEVPTRPPRANLEKKESW